jgi:hypothetical protein
MKTVILYLIIILNNGNDYELRRIISYEKLSCFDWYLKNIEFRDNKTNKYNDLYVNGYICQYQKGE